MNPREPSAIRRDVGADPDGLGYIRQRPKSPGRRPHGAHRRAGCDSGSVCPVSVASDCTALRSPWIFATVVVIELARLIWAERIDEPSHGSHALLWRQRRLGAAHIGPDPSGVDQNTSDAARRQIDRSASHHHVHRRARVRRPANPTKLEITRIRLFPSTCHLTYTWFRAK